MYCMTVCKAHANCIIIPRRLQFALFAFIVASSLSICTSLSNRDIVRTYPSLNSTKQSSNMLLHELEMRTLDLDSNGGILLDDKLTSSVYIHRLRDTRPHQQLNSRKVLPQDKFDILNASKTNKKVVHASLYEPTHRLKRFSRSSNKPKSRRKKKNRVKSSGRSDAGFKNTLVRVHPFSNTKLVLSTPLSTPTSSKLCPIWPRDPKIIVNCSNGRMLRSRCSVDCAPGFRFQAATPSTRRCRVSHKLRRRKGNNNPQPTWSGRDEQFVCVSACRPLKVPPNGRVTCKHGLFGDVVNTFTPRSCEVTCDPGFVPTRAAIRHCQTDGTWSGNDATCLAIPTKQKRPLFVPHHRVKCGNVYGLTTFSRHGTTYLAAGDLTGNILRIYKWANGQFQHWQIISLYRPLMVEVIPHKQGITWLMAGNEDMTSFYRMNENNKFIFSHSSRKLLTTKRKDSNLNQGEGFSLIGYKGSIYRCKGQRNNRGRSIAVVQKLQIRKDKRDVFKRVMRRKMKSGEAMFQCSMFVMNNKLHTLITVNRRNGQGRILFGSPHRNQMKVVDTLKGQALQHLSDVTAFETSNKEQYIAAGQTTPNGQCFVYKRNPHVAEG